MKSASMPPGVSETAEYIESASRQSEEGLRASAVFSRQPAYDELWEVWDACRVPNWDGYHALPVEQDALRNAYKFIEALPLGCPLPSVGAEPDGQITLEWYRDPRWTLSVSISPDGFLYYAALFGESANRGSEPFFGDVPEILLSLVHRVIARR